VFSRVGPALGTMAYRCPSIVHYQSSGLYGVVMSASVKSVAAPGFPMEDAGDEGKSSPREVADLAEALQLMKADTSNLLRDMLRGISMWAVTAAIAFILAGAWLALADAILTYAHPYGSQPLVLDTLNLAYVFSVVSASVGVVLFLRYSLMRKRYSKLFRIAEKLR
jgi:hypothetical protein